MKRVITILALVGAAGWCTGGAGLFLAWLLGKTEFGEAIAAIGLLIAFPALFLTALLLHVELIRGIWHDPRYGPTYIVKSYRAIALFLAVVGIGAVILFTFLKGRPQSPSVAFAAGASMLAWIGLATLWLIRFAPRSKETAPVGLAPVGVVDVALLVIVVSAFAYVVANAQ